MASRLRRVIAALSLIAACAIWGEGSPPSFQYWVELSPKRPVVGGELELVLVVLGLSARDMVIDGPDAGGALALESQTISPYIQPKGVLGTQLRLTFRVLKPGSIRLSHLVLKGKEGSLAVSPLSLVAEPAVSDSGKRQELWEWEAPEDVYRYQAFSLRLRDAAGGSPGATLAATTAALSAPENVSLEAAGLLAWTMTALDAQPIALPDVVLSRNGATVGKAAGATIRVREPPTAIGESRAIGRFGLSLEGLDRAHPRAGEPFIFRLAVSGVGNLPVLRLPEPQLLLDGAPLPGEDVSSRRLDESHPAEGGYEGRALLELTVTPPGPGRLVVLVPPLATLDPEGGLHSLTVESATLRVEGESPSQGGAASGPGGPFDRADAAARRLAAASSRLRTLPALLRSSRGGAHGAAAARRAALELVAPSVGRDARYLEATLLWEGGDRGRALALLYGLVRRRPLFGDARRAAQACAGELGAGSPLLDSLPPPQFFALGGIVFLVSALLFFFVARRRRGSGRGAAAALCLAVAVAGIGLACASALERRGRFAVIWTDRLLVVPSAASQGYVDLPRGSAARVRGAADGYVGLVLGDGLAGWAREDSVYYY